MVPSRCDDGSCPHPWHLGVYWEQDARWTFDEFNDGNHEEVEAADVPVPDEVRAAWVEYAEDAVESGADPFGAYSVPQCTLQRRTWQVRFVPAIVGVVLRQARRGGRGPWQGAGADLDAPDLMAYLGLEWRGGRWFFPSQGGQTAGEETLEYLRELGKCDADCTLQRWSGGLMFLVRVQEERTRAEATVAREVRVAARAALLELRDGNEH